MIDGKKMSGIPMMSIITGILLSLSHLTFAQEISVIPYPVKYLHPQLYYYLLAVGLWKHPLLELWEEEP